VTPHRAHLTAVHASRGCESPEVEEVIGVALCQGPSDTVYLERRAATDIYGQRDHGQ
jgi:hypothetical protein